MENKHDCFFDGDMVLYNEVTKKQKALNVLFTVNNKISDAIFLLYTATHSGIVDKENLNVSLGTLLIEHAKAAFRDEITDLWKDKPLEKKEPIAESSVLGHP
jgi:hypothetical protein